MSADDARGKGRRLRKSWLVVVAGDVASQRRFVRAGVVGVRCVGCGRPNDGAGRWLLVEVVTHQRWVVTVNDSVVSVWSR